MTRDKGHPIPNFPTFTEHKLGNTSITVCEILKLAALSLRRLLVYIKLVFIKNINPESSPIFAKLFNFCLKRRYFPNLWMVSWVSSFSKVLVWTYLHLSISTLISLNVIRKLWSCNQQESCLSPQQRQNHFSNKQHGFSSAQALKSLRQ